MPVTVAHLTVTHQYAVEEIVVALNLLYTLCQPIYSLVL